MQKKQILQALERAVQQSAIFPPTSQQYLLRILPFFSEAQLSRLEDILAEESQHMETFVLDLIASEGSDTFLEESEHRLQNANSVIARAQEHIDQYKTNATLQHFFDEDA